MPKIIHTADIHLDTPFSLFDPQKAQARRNELRGTFSSLMLYAKTEKADMVLIAGDLFDSGFVTKETLALLNAQFSDNPGCKFVISPGNHDCALPKSPYMKAEFPPNVYIFTNDAVTCFRFDDIGVDVYGWGFVSGDMYENPLKGRLSVDTSRINILLAHADLGKPGSSNCPIGVEDIAKSSCDYAALGHVHTGTEVHKTGNTYFAYSGCLEGRSFDECGPKGAIICNLNKNSFGETEADFSYRRFCRRRYEKISVDVTGAATKDDAIAAIKAEAAKNGISRETLLRVRLTGAVSPDAAICADKINEGDVGVYYLEIKDETLPLLSYEELESDLSLRGALFRELLPMLKSEDENERENAKNALRYGLAALDGSDIADF